MQVTVNVTIVHTVPLVTVLKEHHTMAQKVLCIRGRLMSTNTTSLATLYAIENPTQEIIINSRISDSTKTMAGIV